MSLTKEIGFNLWIKKTAGKTVDQKSEHKRSYFFFSLQTIKITAKIMAPTDRPKITVAPVLGSELLVPQLLEPNAQLP